MGTYAIAIDVAGAGARVVFVLLLDQPGIHSKYIYQRIYYDYFFQDFVNDYKSSNIQDDMSRIFILYYRPKRMNIYSCINMLLSRKALVKLRAE